MHFCDTRLVVCVWFNSREKTLCSYRNLFYYAYRAHMLAWVRVSRCTTVCRRPRPMQQFSPSPCPVSLSKASCRLNLRVCVTIFRSAVDFCLPHGVVLRLTCTLLRPTCSANVSITLALCVHSYRITYAESCKYIFMKYYFDNRYALIHETCDYSVGWSCGCRNFLTCLSQWSSSSVYSTIPSHGFISDADTCSDMDHHALFDIYQI